MSAGAAFAAQLDAHPGQPPQIYRGVSYDPTAQMWRARMYCSGKHVTLGRFPTAREAAFVHDRAAYYIHGQAAQTNFGLDAARESNEREPPSSSWRVMATLDALTKEVKMRRIAAEQEEGNGGGAGGGGNSSLRLIRSSPSSLLASQAGLYGARAPISDSMPSTDQQQRQQHQHQRASLISISDHPTLWPTTHPSLSLKDAPNLAFVEKHCFEALVLIANRMHRSL